MSVAVAEERIPNRTLRREFEQRRNKGWVTPELVAFRLGWIRPDGKGDGSRILRILGLVESYNRNGAPVKQQTLSYDRAVEIAEAMNLDPVDVNL